MSKLSMERYRTTLEAKKLELSLALRRRSEIAIERTAEELEQTIRAAEREIVIGALDRNSRLLREVTAALERMANNSYGACQNCREPIKPRRLEAVPWAPYCVQCQEAADRAEAGTFGVISHGPSEHSPSLAAPRDEGYWITAAAARS